MSLSRISALCFFKRKTSKKNKDFTSLRSLGKKGKTLERNKEFLARGKKEFPPKTKEEQWVMIGSQEWEDGKLLASGLPTGGDSGSCSGIS